MHTGGEESVAGKVGVVGVGAVGQACAVALVLRGSCRELMLVSETTRGHVARRRA